nr:MAG TPA: Intein splicing domain [Bacteriophage sp.]
MDELNFIETNYPLFQNGTSKRLIRHNFFSKIETELQAYLLGFIYSDGCINIQRHTLSIHINDIDSELFELFKIISPDAYTQQEEGYESKALVRGHTVKNKSSIRLAISSKILIEDLINLGVCERKTYKNLHIPEMNPNLIGSFIRGYFDGDGCFTWHASAPNLNNRERNWRIKMSWQIDSKTQTLLTEFQKWFETQGVTLKINYIKRDNMYRLCTSSKKTFSKIYNLIFKEAQYSLSRKINKINHYVNTEVTQLIAEYRNA